MKVRETPRAAIIARASVSRLSPVLFLAATAGLQACGDGPPQGDAPPSASSPGTSAPVAETSAPAASAPVAETYEVANESACGTVRRADNADPPRIVFLGTSLTAGYGLDDPALAYPGLLGRRMAEKGWRYAVANAGVSGDTSAGGRARLPQLLDVHCESVAVLFVELGANDGLRARSHEALRENLEWIASETRRRLPDAGIVVAGMEAPPNLGPVYTDPFRQVFRDVAEESGALLVPFLLDGVAAAPALNQADGIHPNAEGHQAVADYVWSFLGDWLEARCRSDGAC